MRIRDLKRLLASVTTSSREQGRVVTGTETFAALFSACVNLAGSFHVSGLRVTICNPEGGDDLMTESI